MYAEKLSTAFLRSFFEKIKKNKLINQSFWPNHINFARLRLAFLYAKNRFPPK